VKAEFLTEGEGPTRQNSLGFKPWREKRKKSKWRWIGRKKRDDVPLFSYPFPVPQSAGFIFTWEFSLLLSGGRRNDQKGHFQTFYEIIVFYSRKIPFKTFRENCWRLCIFSKLPAVSNNVDSSWCYWLSMCCISFLTSSHIWPWRVRANLQKGHVSTAPSFSSVNKYSVFRPQIGHPKGNLFFTACLLPINFLKLFYKKMSKSLILFVYCIGMGKFLHLLSTSKIIKSGEGRGFGIEETSWDWKIG
jgi:hypothetical protein